MSIFKNWLINQNWLFVGISNLTNNADSGNKNLRYIPEVKKFRRFGGQKSWNYRKFLIPGIKIVILKNPFAGGWKSRDQKNPETRASRKIPNLIWSYKFVFSKRTRLIYFSKVDFYSMKEIQLKTGFDWLRAVSDWSLNPHAVVIYNFEWRNLKN